jgi:hypothetical protein
LLASKQLSFNELKKSLLGETVHEWIEAAIEGHDNDGNHFQVCSVDDTHVCG